MKSSFLFQFIHETGKSHSLDPPHRIRIYNPTLRFIIEFSTTLEMLLTNSAKFTQM